MLFEVAIWLVVLTIFPAGVVATVMMRHRMPQDASLRGALGHFPLAAFIYAALTGVLGIGLGLWVNAGEKHTVTVHPAENIMQGCTYTWPTNTAPVAHKVSCTTGDWKAGGTQTTAVGVPGTDHVTILHRISYSLFRDDLSGRALAAAYCMVLGGGIGLVRNVVWTSRRTSDSENRRLLQWYRSAAAPSTTDDLTWERIAELSERPDAHGGPLVHPERSVGIPLTGATLTMQYPYSYVRVMTREPAERSVVLLFVGDDAWFLDVDGVPPRSGTATVSRVPNAPGDLHVTFGEYVYDIADDPTFLPSASLESLRRQCSTWVTRSASDDGAHPHASNAGDVPEHPNPSQP